MFHMANPGATVTVTFDGLGDYGVLRETEVCFEYSDEPRTDVFTAVDIDETDTDSADKPRRYNREFMESFARYAEEYDFLPGEYVDTPGLPASIAVYVFRPAKR